MSHGQVRKTEPLISTESWSRHQPGDLIIERYLPNCTPEIREQAQENLRRYAKVLVKIAMRVLREETRLVNSTTDQT